MPPEMPFAEDEAAHATRWRLQIDMQLQHGPAGAVIHATTMTVEAHDLDREVASLVQNMLPLLIAAVRNQHDHDAA